MIPEVRIFIERKEAIKGDLVLLVFMFQLLLTKTLIRVRI